MNQQQRHITGLSLIGFLVLISVSTSHAADPSRPNVVLIISDDQAWTDYGFMGHDQIRTPHLDQLASQSLVFRRGYVPTALCRPSLMTLATGLYAHQHRTTGNDPAATAANRQHVDRHEKPDRELLISHVDRQQTLPRWLADRGYVSHQSGKWWEGSYQRGGFSHGMTRGYPQRGGRHGDDGLRIGREGLKPIFEFIDDATDQQKPFFVWYAPFLPHTPHNPPQRLLQHYESLELPQPVARYYAMCEWFDETCGELLQGLDDRDIRDNTLVVYVTDNGWIQNPNKNGYAPRSKRSAYEGGIRTPIMFSWPGKIAPGDRPDLCSSIDIVPTILAAAGVSPANDLPGLNLMPTLTTGAAIDRSHIFGESFAHDIADIEDPSASLLHRWVIRGDWKLLLTYDGYQGKMKYPPEDYRPQLFNLNNDPQEQNNVASSQAELVSEMANLLGDWYPTPERRTIFQWQAEPVRLRE